MLIFENIHSFTESRDKMTFSEKLYNEAKSVGVELSKKALENFKTYYGMLIEYNEKMNLTAITEESEVIVKHFADSLCLLSKVGMKENAKVIDVGTGAGFPGIVLKIARPDIELTLLDSLNKRLVFLDTVLSEIGLSAQLIHSRAEDGGQDIDLRESYDFVVSRAVAQLNVLSEYCLPYARLGGSFVALKGPDAENEILNAKKAVQILGGKLKKPFKFSLPNDGGERTIIVIEKNQTTPDKYPRNSGKIKAKPL